MNSENSDLKEDLALRGIRGDFKFTNADSFRLFVEGLKGLQRFERAGEADGLAIAEQKFSEGSRRFLQDTLPEFYLGIVKALQGHPGADEAIRIFSDIADRRTPGLREAALYNLAQAHIEKYEPEHFDKAWVALQDCIKELGQARGSEKQTLQLQARVLWLFIPVHVKLWDRRNEPVNSLEDKRPDVAKDLERQLDQLRRDTERANIPLEAKNSILLDYWNNRGILFETRAYMSSKGFKKAGYIDEAIQSFRNVLEIRPGWIYAQSNLAVVYQDLVGDKDTALKLWGEVLKTRPDDQYAHYNLARISRDKGYHEAAKQHYELAPDIKGTREELASLLEVMAESPERGGTPARQAKPDAPDVK